MDDKGFIKIKTAEERAEKGRSDKGYRVPLWKEQKEMDVELERFQYMMKKAEQKTKQEASSQGRSNAPDKDSEGIKGVFVRNNEGLPYFIPKDHMKDRVH